MIHRMFFYGTLMRETTIRRFIGEEDEIISKRPAFIEGKMYTGGVPMVYKIGELTKNKMPNISFGYMFEIQSEDPSFFSDLDSYEGCSLTRIGKNARHDLYHREKTTVNIIDATTIEDLSNINYNIVDEVEAWVYYGNPETIVAERNKNNRDRIFYWGDFIELLKAPDGC